ncbi:hypothetical protein C8J56DRAFT_972300 [Mycena floridula]|nr:hypothetical protein C8J56DRAFT_972300 [Mycena floridula]
MTSVNDVLERLTSTKIKERGEAVDKLKELFSSNKVLENFAADNDGKQNADHWMTLMSRLFSAVKREKMTVQKGEKGAKTAEIRMANLAHLIRWLIGRAVHLFNTDNLTFILERLLKIQHKDGLWEPVALDFVKGIKTLISYRSHLEHLPENEWMELVRFGFNLILGDDLDAELVGGSDVEESDKEEEDEEEDEELPRGKRRHLGQASPMLEKRRITSNSSTSNSSRVIVEIEFNSILTILLQSPYSPILRQEDLPHAILQRCLRALNTFTDSSTLHIDFLHSLAALLSQLSLNRRNDTIKFARRAWKKLISLWGHKHKPLKEAVVVVLHHLLPFVAADLDSPDIRLSMKHDWSDGIWKLSNSLDAAASSSKWGTDPLELNALRLELMPSDHDEAVSQAFVAKTFRAGLRFTADQALTWAILEMQADCAEMLYAFSENRLWEVASPRGTHNSKRRDPISGLLSSLRIRTSESRVYHYQVLLFIIDRHWTTLHAELQQSVIDHLMQSITSGEAIIQSWVFLCLAAVAYHDGHIPESRRSAIESPRRDATIWDAVWIFALRRVNTPATCRAACHTAHTLIVSFHSSCHSFSHPRLSSRMVLTEIENFTKDLDVQGPAYPFDSVSMFLTHCLSIASQDVRLYRMHLEDKVLSWLLDSWKVRDRTELPLQTSGDIIRLFEVICGFSNRTSLICRSTLPNCLVVQSLVEQQTNRVIRDYVLHAKLPAVRKRRNQKPTSDMVQDKQSDRDRDLVDPRGRERKVSAFMQKTLEALGDECEKSQAELRAERARDMLDTAVIALSFESLAILNGIAANRAVMQRACKVINTVLSINLLPKWSITDKAVILLALEPLVASREKPADQSPFLAILAPDADTGIKSTTLKELTFYRHAVDEEMRISRMEFQRNIWRHSDVSQDFRGFVEIMRGVLDQLVENGPRSLDDGDGFGHIKDVAEKQSRTLAVHASEADSIRCIAEVCFGFLAFGPILQSNSGEPTRDKPLLELVLKCADVSPERFWVIFPVLLEHIRFKTFTLSFPSLGSYLDFLGDDLSSRDYSKNEALFHIVLDLLDSTMHLWSQVGSDASEGLKDVQHKVKILMRSWLFRAWNDDKLPSWRARDALARFTDRYIALDPVRSCADMNDDDVASPMALICRTTVDRDIRVRFRGAVLSAKLFRVAQRGQYMHETLYLKLGVILQAAMWRTEVKPPVLFQEVMITRLLTFGNIMVASSAIRRGPYWHLIEPALRPLGFRPHIQAILGSVAAGLGLKDTRSLFEAYSFHLAISILKDGSDFLNIPYNLLGFSTLTEFATVSFPIFTPAYLFETRASQLSQLGERSFEAHCQILQKTPDDGIQQCFGAVVAHEILFWFKNETLMPEGGLEPALLQKTRYPDRESFTAFLQENVDAVAAAMLETLEAQEFSENCEIMVALKVRYEHGDYDPTGAASAFSSLMKYRRAEDFYTHDPDPPRYPAGVVIYSLTWLIWRCQIDPPGAVIYHVLQALFSKIHSYPLVNEQFRLVNAIAIWVAINHRHFKSDIMLLHMLMHGACAMMVQSDLAHAAQSFLDWAFSQYIILKTQDQRFPDIFVRTCCLAYDYSLDPDTAELGRELLQWMDAQALRLAQVQPLDQQILNSLPAWPSELSPDLEKKFRDTISSNRLSAVLGDRKITSNKFRIVRRLCDPEIYNQQSFSATDFWRLKESIPPKEHLHDIDIYAFAELLVCNQGVVSGFGDEQLSTDSGHRGQKDEAAESAILRSLLIMLDGHDPVRMHAAYTTLRLISSTDSILVWPKDYRCKEAEYLKVCRRPARPTQAATINDILGRGYVDSCVNFSQWVAMVSGLLSAILSATDTFYAQLQSILQRDAAFGQSVLPVLVWKVLVTDPSSKPTLSEYFTSILSSDRVEAKCRQAIVDIVLHLRTRKSPSEGSNKRLKTSDALGYNRWLAIDFGLLAETAISCGAYTTALLFLELAADSGDAPGSRNGATERIMYDIYSHIDEPDGFYGIKDPDHHQFLLKRFHHEKQWEKAFRFHGAALEAGSTDAQESDGMLQAFHSFGFNHLAVSSFQPTTDNPASSSMTYHLGWRTETWDLPDRGGAERTPGHALYLALRAEHRERNPKAVESTVRNALIREMQHLRSLGPEDITQIREVIQSLMCLSQVVQWAHPMTRQRLTGVDIDELSDFLNIEAGFDFSDSENIMATRISLLRSARQKEERQQIGDMRTKLASNLLDMEKQCLLRISSAAREAHHNQIALNSVIRAERLDPSFEVSEEFARVLWDHDEEKRAVQLLTSLRERAQRASQPPIKLSLINACLGTWMSKACLEKPSHIWQHFFDVAGQSIQHEPSTETHAKIYHECAVFAESQYRALLRSPDVFRAKLYLDRKVQEIQRLEEDMRRSGAKHLSKVLTTARATKEKDSEIHNQYTEGMQKFLSIAIEMYCRCLEASDYYDDDALIRVCSLWLANFDNARVNCQTFVTAVEQWLKQVPSRKFVFLSHQLSARLSQGSRPARAQNTSSLSNEQAQERHQQQLHYLIIRMCQEHPFHSLYQVFALRPANGAAPTACGLAAKTIFDRVLANPDTQKRAIDVEFIARASLEWAQHKIPKTPPPASEQPIPSNMLILRIPAATKVPVMTLRTPPDQTMEYENCIWIHRYEPRFKLVGGLTLPKLCECHAEDGNAYKQMFKGDDLRQDGVMEQVFDLCNMLFKRNRETSRRKLLVRDYKVIPLAPLAGVIEFVDGTLPLSKWLESAHPRYRPGDPSLVSTRKLLSGEPPGSMYKESSERRIKTFVNATQKVKPVMRHYFTEHHKRPIAWFAMRLNYIRSVATTSMVGHVLGLGDRHVSNILIDERTGEVVHIDLGIAFDQGKFLPIPEQVPFRMTSDMVDGMGVAGTDGVFQRCAEETLRVLREGSDVIMTVLEVFRHDPLDMWTTSSTKIQRVQPGAATISEATAALGIAIDSNSTVAAESADRALSGVARKLEKTLSVESTVSGLITEARDPANLGMLFAGWSPYL